MTRRERNEGEDNIKGDQGRVRFRIVDANDVDESVVWRDRDRGVDHETR